MVVVVVLTAIAGSGVILNVAAIINGVGILVGHCRRVFGTYWLTYWSISSFSTTRQLSL
jgi:hypothetical protein